ncbi:MAG TPA: HD-GYP domain-containing protein [Acidimicrobiia bacterium]|nr:HD-GYP domain-containing protein [Acidimicrobiia bacterium]
MAARRDRWVARPIAAGVIRVLIVVVPAVAGALAAWEMGRVLADPSGLWPTVGWFAALVGVAVAVVLVVQRGALRLLPLAWLFTLTLAFPDRAPSRLVAARRAASRRQQRKALERLRDHGLGRDAAEAAEAALVLVAALGAHDRRTRGHSERVRTLADLLAEEAGVVEEDRDRLRWAALLHDIGKLSVPGAILNKPDRPDADEWATLRRHPEEGAHLVEPLVTWLGPWSGAVAHHHEKWDGTGYPQGLAGEDISLGGRILAIADAYEVMTAARAYKKPLTAVSAREELVASSGTHFDPNLVRAFMSISLGALWWAAGASAALAQVPLLARVSAAPGFARIRSGLAGSATAVGTVTALVVAGAVGGASSGGAPAASRKQATESAAPAFPPAAPPVPAASGPEPASEPETSSTSTTSPARPLPSIDRLLGGIATASTATTSTTFSPVPPTGSPSPPSSPSPNPPSPPPATRPFTAKGQLLAPDLLGRLGLGLTSRGPAGGCGPSASQGLDAWVFVLPDDAPGAGTPVKATGSDLLGLHNLAVTFLDRACSVVGQFDTAAADEAGVLPEGTHYVVVSDRLGLGTAVTLTVG